MSSALFWDIDGTLLHTARAGIRAWEDALVESGCATVSLEDFPTAGMTDGAIARALSSRFGDGTEQQARRMLGIYAALIPEALRTRLGHVFPGVRDALEDLGSRPGIRNMLLTGNVEVGAWAKLDLYGLAGYFRHGGAFCAGDGSRETIARNARALAPDAEHVYVIGDTPADIACGKAIDARTVAIATGHYDSASLAAHDPWLVLERIPEPIAFRAALQL